jgi:predicted Ser/Thr protein kinase
MRLTASPLTQWKNRDLHWRRTVDNLKSGQALPNTPRKRVVSIRTPLIQARANGDPASIDRFQVLGRLGAGGFGVVYAARVSDGYPHGDGLAAIKVVHPHLAATQGFSARFAREITAIGMVNSEFVPKIFAYNTSDNPPWLASQLVPGPSLDRAVTDCGRPLPEAAVWHLGAGIAEALAAIHDAGITHRDLKPQNVLVTRDRPWIIDFGLAYLADAPHNASSQLPMATYQYAAPEQIRDGLAGAAKPPADVFTLGGTLLFAATGHPPYEATTRDKLYFKALAGKPNLSGLPRAIYGLVESCLLYSPAARPSLAEVRAEIDRHLRGRRGRGGFTATLPAQVLALLDGCHEEIAKFAAGRGPATQEVRAADLRAGRAAAWEERSRDADVAREQAGRGDGQRSAQAGTPQRLRDDAASGLPPIRSFAGLPAPRYTLVAANTPGWTGDEPGDTGDLTGLRPFGQGPTAVDDLAAVDRSPAAGQPAGVDQPKRSGWTYPVGDWTCSQVAVHHNLCVVARLDGVVTGLFTNDHREVAWSPVDLDGRCYGAPAIVPGGSGGAAAAYVALGDGRLCAINIATGGVTVVLPPGPAVEGSPVVVPDPLAPRVYVVLADGKVLAIDPRTYHAEELYRLEDGTTGALAVAGDVVCVADRRGVVHQVSTATRGHLGRVRTGGQVFAAPVPVGNRVYVVGTDGILREAALPGGEELGQAKLGAPVHVTPVHDAGLLYVGAADGRLHAFEIRRSGGLIPAWEPPELGQEITGLAVADGMLYVAAGYQVSAFDVSTGAFRRQVTELNCLTAAAPVISGQFAYITGLGGVVRCAPLR